MGVIISSLTFKRKRGRGRRGFFSGRPFPKSPSEASQIYRRIPTHNTEEGGGGDHLLRPPSDRSKARGGGWEAGKKGGPDRGEEGEKLPAIK